MPKTNVKWICCVSRMNIQAGNVPGLKVCKGSEKLQLSHCHYCEFWKENRWIFNKTSFPEKLEIHAKDKAEELEDT